MSSRVTALAPGFTCRDHARVAILGMCRSRSSLRATNSPGALSRRERGRGRYAVLSISYPQWQALPSGLVRAHGRTVSSAIDLE